MKISKKNMRSLYKFIASGFGTGYLPKAPGTWGALGALLIMLPFYFLHYEHITILLACCIFVFTLLGVWSANRVESEWGHDPKKVVIDEMVGLWVSIIFIPFSWVNLIVGFILFRFFDIFKPLGIRHAEKLNGGYGVMADDLVAGVYANVVLNCLIFVLE